MPTSKRIKPALFRSGPGAPQTVQDVWQVARNNARGSFSAGLSREGFFDKPMQPRLIRHTHETLHDVAVFIDEKCGGC